MGVAGRAGKTSNPCPWRINSQEAATRRSSSRGMISKEAVEVVGIRRHRHRRTVVGLDMHSWMGCLLHITAGSEAAIYVDMYSLAIDTKISRRAY